LGYGLEPPLANLRWGSVQTFGLGLGLEHLVRSCDNKAIELQRNDIIVSQELTLGRQSRFFDSSSSELVIFERCHVHARGCIIMLC